MSVNLWELKYEHQLSNSNIAEKKKKRSLEYIILVNNVNKIDNSMRVDMLENFFLWENHHHIDLERQLNIIVFHFLLISFLFFFRSFFLLFDRFSQRSERDGLFYIGYTLCAAMLVYHHPYSQKDKPIQ
jgi:hypothetical protein